MAGRAESAAAGPPIGWGQRRECLGGAGVALFTLCPPRQEGALKKSKRLYPWAGADLRL